MDEKHESDNLNWDPVDADTFMASGMDRRGFLRFFLITAGVAFGISQLSILKMLIAPKLESQQRKEVDNTFIYSKVEDAWFSEKAGEEVHASDFKTGMGAAVLWRRSIPAIVIKLDTSQMNTEEGVDQGLVAFCSWCTHLGCIINWHIDRPEMDMLFCRCHDGIFTPYEIVSDKDDKGVIYRGGKVISGPLPRALPQIPVLIKDGKVTGVPSHLEWYEY